MSFINIQGSLMKSKFYPTIRKNKDYFKHFALVGIGGNLGNVPKTFRNLFRLLLDDRRLRVIETSLIFKNPPFGYLAQNDFYNSIMLIQTSLEPKNFLKLLQNLEKKFKRVRKFLNSPRTLDLDIIFFDDIKLYSKSLIIPHKCWRERKSVIVPLGFLKKIYEG